MIAEELHAVASNVTSAPTDATQSPDFGSLFQQYVNQFTSDASQALATVDGAVVLMCRLAFVTLLLLGVLLYFTRLHRRLGKDLIYGGVILAILSEVIFPLFSLS